MISKALLQADTVKKFQQDVRSSKVDIFAGDGKGNTLLHFAAMYNKPNIIKWLVEQKVSLNYVNKLDMSPLHLACLFNKEEATAELIKQGAEVNCVNIHGLTPLHYACMRMNRTNATKLLNNGASPYTQSKTGLTPYKSSHGDFLIELMDSVAQIQLDKITTVNLDTPPRPRKEFSSGEIAYDKSLLLELDQGKMGRIDHFYRGSIDDEKVLIRVCSFPKLTPESREKLYDHLVETQLTDHFNILGVIGPMLISQSEIGIILRDNGMPTLRNVIENNATVVANNNNNNGEHFNADNNYAIATNAANPGLQVWQKVSILRGILSAVNHIYTALEMNYRDMEISPDTILVDQSRGEGFLQMVTRSDIEGLHTFMPNPEFIAPERLATGAVSKELNNEHTYAIGALWYYLMKERPYFEGQDAQDIAEIMVSRYRNRQEIYETTLFAISTNNQLFGVLISTILSKRVPIDILSNTRAFDILLELLLEKENFLRLYEGKEEDIVSEANDEDVNDDNDRNESSSLTDEDSVISTHNQNDDDSYGENKRNSVATQDDLEDIYQNNSRSSISSSNSMSSTSTFASLKSKISRRMSGKSQKSTYSTNADDVSTSRRNKGIASSMGSQKKLRPSFSGKRIRKSEDSTYLSQNYNNSHNDNDANLENIDLEQIDKDRTWQSTTSTSEEASSKMSSKSNMRKGNVGGGGENRRSALSRSSMSSSDSRSSVTGEEFASHVKSAKDEEYIAEIGDNDEHLLDTDST